MLIAAAGRLSSDFYDTVASAIAESDGTAEGLLRARLRVLFSFDFNYPYYYRLIAEEVAPALTPEAAAVRANLDRIGSQLDAELTAPGFRPVDSRMLRIALLGICEFFRYGSSYIKGSISEAEYQEFLA